MQALSKYVTNVFRCLAKLIKSDIDGKTNFESEGIENFCKVFESGKPLLARKGVY